MSKALTCPVILTGASTRSDGSLSLRFASPELAPDEKTAFFEMLNKPSKMLLQLDGEQLTELKEVKGEFCQKSPSTRLRSVLFIQWKQQQPGMNFDEFYRQRMNFIIEQQKQYLDSEPT